MFKHLFPDLQAGPSLKALREAMDRLPGQPVLVAIESLYAALQESLALAAGSATVRRIVSLMAPVCREWTEQALDDLAQSPENPARRELIAQRLALLADLLAQTSHAEAMREAARVEKGTGRAPQLAEWTEHYWYWLGVAHSARALIDTQHNQLGWASVVPLFLALVRCRVLPENCHAADAEPARSLAFLLLSHDAFSAVPPAEVIIALRLCRQLAGEVRLAADFSRATPLVMDVEANDASRLVGWGGPSPASPALCYGLEEPARLVRAMQQDATVGRLPVWLATMLRPGDWLARLLHAWSTRPGRCRNPAARRLGEVRVACDFLRIRGLLAQKSDRLPSNDPYLLPAQVDDADDAGIGLLLAPTAESMLDSGLIAVNAAQQGWWLARPVRVMQEPDGPLFVAARWLGHEAEPVRLSGAAGDSHWALYLKASPANGYQSMLLLDEASLQTDQPCQLALVTGMLEVKPAEPVRIGPALWCYRCQPV